MEIEKQKLSNTVSEAGFTLLELLVTLAILALFYGLILTNFSVWRGPQYVKVSANELITNASKIRSYALSARNLQGNPAKLYVLKFTTAQPGVYQVQGLAAGPSGDVYYDAVETIRLPGGAVIQDITLVSPAGATTHPTCMQLAFALPFGRTHMNPSCDFDQPKSPSSLDALGNAVLRVQIGRPGVSVTRTLVVDGVTGRMEIQ